MIRAALLAALLVLPGCAAPIAPAVIGAALGAVAATENLDVTLIDAYLSLHGMKSAPIPAKTGTK